MRKSAIALVVLGMALNSVLNVEVASAQTGSNLNTLISGVGSDSGTCVTSPCLTLTYTLTQTQPGGDVYVAAPWQSGNENVTITGAVTIHGGIFPASFGATTGTALTINAGSSDKIVLNNLHMRNFGTATNGIVFNSGGGLFLKDTEISGFSNIGLTFSPNTSGGSSKLMMRENSRVNANNNGNILLRPVGSTSVVAGIKDGIIFGSNVFGLKIDTTAGTAQVRAEIIDSVILNLGTNGITVNSPINAGNVLVYQTHISEAANYGVYANGANAVILLDNSTITHSGNLGVANNAGGIVGSYGNNGINLNANDNTGILTPTSLH